MTRDFEIVEMDNMGDTNRRLPSATFAATTSYAVSTSPPADMAADENISQRVMDSFKRAPGARLADQKGYRVQDRMPDVEQDRERERERERERYYDVDAANARTAATGLSRELKGRHLQMIAIGGSIGRFC